MSDASLSPWLFSCDIDGTLLLPERGNPGLAELNRALDGAGNGIVFALNSGRDLADIALACAEGPIHRPDWIISSVGTELHSGFGEDSADGGWTRVMARDWGRAGIRAALSSYPGLAEQESHHQHPAKLSYYLQALAAEALPEIKRLLAPWGASCKVVESMGYFLDVMPPWGGKGSAVAYLANKLGIPDDRIVVAGDSGNDRDMLARGWRSIVVANRTADLDDLSGVPLAFMASAEGALGVLEGLRHFGVIPS